MQGCRACRRHTHTRHHMQTGHKNCRPPPPPPPSPSAKRFPCQGATRRPEARPCWSASCVLALLSARRPARCDKRGAKVEALAKIPRLQRCSKLLIAKGKTRSRGPGRRSPGLRPGLLAIFAFQDEMAGSQKPHAQEAAQEEQIDRQCVDTHGVRSHKKMSSILFLQSLKQKKKSALGLELLRLIASQTVTI